MRVLLASAPHRDTFGYSMPPPGLLRLGGELLRRGVDVRLDDLAYRLAAGELPEDDGLCDAAAARLLADGPPDVLGLSTMGATLPAALAIAAAVRSREPGVRVLLGGPGTTGTDRELLARFPAVDAVVRGEGEVTLPAVLEHLAGAGELDLAGVAGVTWRDAAGRVRREPDRPPLADLGELPPYARELLPPLAAYERLTGEEEGLTPLDSGRGCVYDCSFCTIGRFWGRRSRCLPAARLADEVAELRGLEGARRAYLCHDIFGADRSHALAFCDELTRRGLDVPWECRARVDHLDPELVERMGAAGCYRVLLGVESAAHAVRERHGKRMRADVDVLAAVERLTAAGITPILSFVLGLPGEGEEELGATLDLAAAAALRAGTNLSLHLVNPQPGCALGEEHGATSRPVEGIPPDMAWGAGLTADEQTLIRAHPDLFGTWALLTGLSGGEERLRSLHAIASELPEVLMRYPRTWHLCRRDGRDSLALWRAWRASGRSFEAWVLAARDPWAEDALRWEQAVVRAAARGRAPAASPPPGSAGPAGPLALPEVVELAHDVPRAVASGELAARPTLLAVLPGARGVRTLRVSADVARVLRLLDGRTPLERLEREHPGLAAAARQLGERGLVRLAASVTSPAGGRILPHE